MLLVSILNVNAQKLAVDKIGTDGSRVLITKNYNLFYEYPARDVQFGLGFVVKDTLRISQITLRIGGDIKIDNDNKLLFKLEDESIVELWNYSNKYSVPSYLIKENDIVKLINGNVTKVRIEHSLGVVDKEIKKNSFSKKLKEAYDNIVEALKNKKDFYTGF